MLTLLLLILALAAYVIGWRHGFDAGAKERRR